MAKDPKLFANRMLDAIANIEADIVGHDFDSFSIDRRAKQLVERNLDILSEASRRLPEHMKAEEKGIDRRAKQLVERNLEILSEASRRLPEHMKAEEKGIDWTAIAGIGNVLRQITTRASPSFSGKPARKTWRP